MTRRVDFKPLRSILAWVALLAGCIAIAWSLVDHWDEVAARLATVRSSEIALGLAMATLMMGCSALAFALLVHGDPARGSMQFRTACIYLVAQPLKYIPGRLWSVVYQVMKVGETVGTRAAISASLTHLGVTIIGSILVFGLANGGGWLMFVAGIGATLAWIWRGGFDRYVAMPDSSARSVAHVVYVFLAVCAEWICFIGVTWSICLALSVPAAHTLTLTALYAGAWLIGSFVALAPGGIGIREGSFILLSPLAGVSAEFATSFAFVARFAFIAAEAVSAGVALAVLSAKTERSS